MSTLHTLEEIFGGTNLNGIIEDHMSLEDLLTLGYIPTRAELLRRYKSGPFTKLMFEHLSDNRLIACYASLCLTMPFIRMRLVIPPIILHSFGTVLFLI